MRWWISALTIASWVLWAAARVQIPRNSRDFRITFFDVGQGDGALVEFPGGERWVIDAGGFFDLSPELARNIPLYLDRLVASHYDQDHIQGFFPLFTFSIGELSTGEPPDGTQRLGRELCSAGALHRVPIRRYTKNRWEWIAGVEVRWWASEGFQKKSNNRSLVTEFRHGNCRVLFTGDIEAIVERELSQWVGETDLLKVPHHGSRTSSSPDLLESLRPTWAVISSGYRNRYGHPKSEVTWAFRARGVDLLRTDFHGFLQFEITRDELRCRSAHGHCGYSKCRREGTPFGGKDPG